MSVQLYRTGPNKQSQKERGLAVAEIFLIQARIGLEWRFHGNSKSPTMIHTTESFGPLQVIMGVKSVWKQKTWLECNL
jgi:hypothetical protein